MTDNCTPPRVLVLLASYNGERWIASQVDSILRQELVDVHVVVGDDRSSDATVAKLQPYSAENLTLVRRALPSGSAAQNFFSLIREIDAQDFDFIAFSDQDDLWHADRLARAARILSASDHAGYSSATTACWDSGKRRTLRQSSRVTLLDFLFEGAGQGCTFVLARAFYRRLRTFFIDNESLTADVHYHDWATYAVARAWGLPWKFDNRATVDYRQHDRNDTGARSSARGISKRISQLAQGWYKNQLLRIGRLALAAAPENPLLRRWLDLICSPRGFERRLLLATICWRMGRRKLIDRTALVISVFLGWI